MFVLDTLNPVLKNNITVLNSETVDKADGPLKVIRGYALPTNEVGKLTVKLETVAFPAPCKYES